MRIAVNTQHLLKNKMEGIGWFAHETLSRIVRNHPEHEFIFIFDRSWDNSFIYADNVTPVKTTIPSRHPFLWFWHYEIDTIRILKKYNPDIYFSPDGWMPLRSKTPIVNVIHDLNFAHRPADFPLLVRYYYNYFFPRFAAKAKRLITVSEYSKTDIVETYKIPPDKIDVAYNGCNPDYLPVADEVKTEIRNKFTKGAPFFIYVGSRNPRKNISGLLDAFEQFKKTDTTGYKLLFVGEPMWDNSYLSGKINQMNFKNDLVFTGRLSTEVLQLVLASAEALMLVSFSEGFGIPVIEAMHCNIPVICSNQASLPEVAGDAALFVDPNSIDSISDAMKKLTGNIDLRKGLSEKGKMQCEKFNWEDTANQVWKSIEKAVL
jgi:glycosyltransferase involved in cell wall biosynthesis